jgi:hypothetical protein
MVLQINARWALASDKLQWVLQRLRGKRWQDVAFVASTRDVLARVMREWGVPDADAKRALAQLPAAFEGWPEATETGAGSAKRSRAYSDSPGDGRIVPEASCPGMYRVRRADGSLSDMVNLARRQRRPPRYGRPARSRGRMTSKPRKPRVRSGISSGRRVFPIAALANTDFGRRYTDIYRAHVSDLGGDVSQAQDSLARRAAALTIQLETMEARMANNETVDLDLYGRLVGHARRVHETLGLERRARNVTPDLKTYLQLNYPKESDTNAG